MSYQTYIDDVKNGRILTNNHVKLSIKRFENFRCRDDMYFDEKKVQHVIDFISQIKHFKAEFANQPFILEDWQLFFIANIFGFKWKKNDKQVCRSVFLSVARKNGKSALVIAIVLYMMFFSDNAPEIVECANSREQAKEVLFNTTKEFAKSIDPKSKLLKSYRNEIKCKANKGQIKIVSADASKLDGLNLNVLLYDEFAEAKNDLLYSVLQSSMGNRQEPLSIVCGTVAFNLSSTYFEMYETAIEILNDLKTDDALFPLIYTLDEEDNFNNQEVWIKANPNLNVSVFPDYIETELTKAKNNPSYLNRVLTKNFNKWCSTNESWISNDRIVQNTKKLNINDFAGYSCYVGVDLASVSDLTAVSYLFNKDEHYYIFTDYYLPQSALTEHQQKEFYKKMYNQKHLKITSGNVTDYNYITADLLRVNEIAPIQGVFYDTYNSVQWAIDATDKGLNLIPYSQSVANFNRPTKEFQRLMLSDKITLDDNELTRFCFNNVVIWRDNNDNEKPKKINNKSKIDGAISCIEALGGYLQNPIVDDDILTI